MKRMIMGLAATALILTGCSKNEVIDSAATSPENAIGFGVYVGKTTKAQEETSITLKKEGNAFGVLAHKHTGSFSTGFDNKFMENQEVKYVTNAFTYSPEMYWPASDKVTFVAYYPYVSGEGPTVTDGKIAIPWTVDATPATQKDLLWDAVKDGTRADPKVAFEFKHALSKVVFKAKTNKLYAGFAVTGIKISDINSKGTYTISADLGVGTWGAPTAPVDYVILTGGDIHIIETTPVELGASLLMIPQTLSSEAKVTITYTLGVEAYTKEVKLSKDANTEWGQNKSYVYTLNLSLDAVSFDASVGVFDADNQVDL